MNPSIRRISFSVALVTGLLAIAACSDSTGTPPAASTERPNTKSSPVVSNSAAQPATSAVASNSAGERPDRGERGDRHGDHAERGEHGEHGEHGRRFSPAMSLIHDAEKLPDLDDKQKAALAAISASLKPSDADREAMKKNMEAMRDFDKALAAQVRAGKVDKAALPKVTPPAEMPAMAQSHRDALKKVHDTLTASQRKALVDKLQAKQNDDKPGDKHEMKGKEHGFGMFKSLDLTDAQKTKLEEAMKAAHKDAKPKDDKTAHEARKAKMQAFLTSFASDTFDPATAAPMHDMGDKASTMLDHKVEMMTTLLTVLTPEQRTKLADELEKGGGDHMRGPKGELALYTAPVD